ncbi:MAG: PEP-utilizing enzyme [Acidimicrobiia bacterium]|nr:PEP-utilizing enzyme [Acidimicrobiia bacterium]
MSDPGPTSELRFEAPGPGSWALDPVHFPRPVTRYWVQTHPAAFKRGTNDFARFYGMLIDGLEMQYVNGFAYSTMVPAPDAEVPQRFERAAQVYADKLWREQLREWDETVKPAAIAAHREIQAVDPDALSDEDLVAYLARCRDHHQAMIAQHMRYTAGAVVPTGDFLAHVGDWTGIAPAELLGLMRGAAPVSAGGSDELVRLTTTVGQDAKAMELLHSDGDPAGVLAELRALPGDAGPAVAGYLDLVGCRPLDGFDISEPSALELPDALLRAIRVAVEGRDPESAVVDDKIADVRSRVPEEHRSEFDELLGEARLMYRLRDERGIYSDIWASGLMRRAALAAGRRLASQGRIQDAEHIVDAELGEMCSLVADASGPSAEELAARFDYRAGHSAKEAPPFLGDPPHPPPDPSGLPPDIGRLMRATGIALGSLFGSSEAEHEEDLLRGLAASPGVFEGPARLVSGPSEFARIEQGDVLVTPSTTEAFNILLPLLGAIVTDNGGLLSHSAIVAREYGIPGVVGTREATERIADGMRVRVDGDAGEVSVLT